MANRENSIAYENLNRRIFSDVGEYDIPQIEPELFEGNCEFVGFNYARGKCNNKENGGAAMYRFTANSKQNHVATNEGIVVGDKGKKDQRYYP